MKKGNLGRIILIVLPLIVAIWTLYPTYQFYSLEKIREEMTIDENGKVDSLKLQEFNEQYAEELESARSGRIKLGLDLRGGMYVTLEVDIIKLIEESAQRDAIDDIFEEVIAKTKADVGNSDVDVIDVFATNFEAIARPGGRSYFSYFETGDDGFDEALIIEQLRENADDAVDQAIEIMRQRINKYGVSEPSIQKQGARRIVLELPGVSNEAEVRDLIVTTARLEFKLVRNNGEVARAFYAIDQLLLAERGGASAEDEAVVDPVIEAVPETDDTTTVVNNDSAAATIAAGDSAITDSGAVVAAAAGDTAVSDSVEDPYAGLSEDEQREKYRELHPFTSLFDSYINDGGNFQRFSYESANLPDVEYFFYIPGENIKEFERILERRDVRRLLTNEYEVAITANPDPRSLKEEGAEIHEMYGLKAEPELTGDVITNASENFDPTTNQPVVLMSMNSDGADRWSRITGANIKKRVAIVLDGRIYSAPVVQDRINGGNSQISGSASIQEANLLAIVLKAGALKAPVKVIEERIVGPSLGEDSITAGVQSSIAALALVILFMIVYYMAGGAVADIAVFLNVVLIIAILASFEGTLTLPGIAGLVLTIGMAVDANILIFERIREELYNGRTMRSAIDEGFSKALSAILDSNITTFIIGVILYYFGAGPIQGFAVTLMIGIVMTLFTAIMLTRAIIELILSRGGSTAKFNFGQPSLSANT